MRKSFPAKIGAAKIGSLNLAITLAFSATLVLPASAATPSAEMIARHLQQLGPRETVNLLVKRKRWDAVTDQIAAGRPDWIALTPGLARGTDAAASETLSIALAYALPKAPSAVLRVLTPTAPGPLGVRRVCSAPFIEDAVKDIPAYRRRALAAVGRIADPRLRPARNACFRVLEPR